MSGYVSFARAKPQRQYMALHASRNCPQVNKRSFRGPLVAVPDGLERFFYPCSFCQPVHWYPDKETTAEFTAWWRKNARRPEHPIDYGRGR